MQFHAADRILRYAAIVGRENIIADELRVFDKVGQPRSTIIWSKATYTSEQHGETDERAVDRRDR